MLLSTMDILRHALTLTRATYVFILEPPSIPYKGDSGNVARSTAIGCTTRDMGPPRWGATRDQLCVIDDDMEQVEE